MKFDNQLLRFFCLSLTLSALCLPTWVRAQDDSTKRVDALMATFNDETIPFNDRLITLGKADAKINGVLVFGLSADTSYLVTMAVPQLIKKYVDSGIMKLTIIEHAITWHDMQAFAGFRCVPSEKHWELLQRVAKRDERQAFYMKDSDYLKAPSYIWPMMDGFGVSRELAEKCMRNSAIVGHMEGQRRTVNELWNVKSVPTFIVGDKVMVTPSSFGIIEDAIEIALKATKP